MICKDAFYSLKLEKYAHEFFESGFKLLDSYKLAEKKLESEYDEKGRYVNFVTKPFYEIARTEGITGYENGYFVKVKNGR